MLSRVASGAFILSSSISSSQVHQSAVVTVIWCNNPQTQRLKTVRCRSHICGLLGSRLTEAALGSKLQLVCSSRVSRASWASRLAGMCPPGEGRVQGPPLSFSGSQASARFTLANFLSVKASSMAKVKVKGSIIRPLRGDCRITWGMAGHEYVHTHGENWGH